MRIGGRVVKCLFNAGSTINVMSFELAKFLGFHKVWKPTDWSIRVANGHNEVMLGQMLDLPVTIGSITWKLTIFVSRTLTEYLILGRPFERVARITWDNRDDGSLWGTAYSPTDARSVQFRAAVDFTNDNQGMTNKVNVFRYENTPSFSVDQESAFRFGFNSREQKALAESKIAKDKEFVRTLYKRVDRKVKPVNQPLTNGLKPEGSSYAEPRAQFERGLRMTLERLESITIGKDQFLHPSEMQLFEDLLVEFEEIFAFETAHMGQLNPLVEPPVIIHTIPHVPWQKNQMKLSEQSRQALIEIVKDRLKNGLLEPSMGPYRNQFFLVPKRDGRWRLICDLQPCNKVTIKDSAIPPNTDEISQALAGAICYTGCDMYSGYNGIPLDPVSRDLTAIQTPLGKFRYTTLPEGFTNSVAIFQ